MLRRRLLFAAFGLLALAAFCSLAFFLGLPFLSLPEAHAPYADADLIRADTAWDLRGLHTARAYRTEDDVMTVAQWYRDGEPVPRLWDEGHITCADSRLQSPVPNSPIPFFVLSRYTVVKYCDDGAGAEITTDTFIYLRRIGP